MTPHTRARPPTPSAGRLLDGLAQSIVERGYRDTTVADVVRTRRPANAPSTTTSPARRSASSNCCAPTTTTLIDEHSRRGRPRCSPLRPGRRRPNRLRRSHRGPARHHTELDPRGARTRRRWPAAASARDGRPDRHARRPQRQPRVPTCWAATDLTGRWPLILLGGLRELTASYVEDGARRPRHRSTRPWRRPAHCSGRTSNPASAAPTSPVDARCPRMTRSPCLPAPAPPSRASPAIR